MRIFKEMAIVALATFAGIYLMFPSFIPDFLPFIGWLDEGFCTLILANTASYYGINLTNIYGSPPKKRRVIRRKKRLPSAEEQPPMRD
jgi:uncharacterized membrane protein YkvA (DUF1232 family)